MLLTLQLAVLSIRIVCLPNNVLTANAVTLALLADPAHLRLLAPHRTISHSARVYKVLPI